MSSKCIPTSPHLLRTATAIYEIMRVLVTGASGLVGSNFSRHLTELGHEVVGTHRNNPGEKTVYLNCSDSADPKNFDVAQWKPDAIVHCAALTAVDYIESHEEESFVGTVTATKNMVAMAQQQGAALVFISTDYIFDGRNGPYGEDAEPNPINIYGRHKLESERAALGYEKSIVLRVTNVYGDEAAGKNFVSRLSGNAARQQQGDLKLPVDQYATPINAWDIARVGAVLLRDGRRGVYNVGSTDYMNRVQLAQLVLSYYPDHKFELTPMTTAALNPPAARPLQGGLKMSKFLSEYPDFRLGSVKEYLDSKHK